MIELITIVLVCFLLGMLLGYLFLLKNKDRFNGGKYR